MVRYFSIIEFIDIVVIYIDKKGDAVVSVKEEGGVLKAHATKDIIFSITPHDTGRYTYYISVMNMKTMTHVSGTPLSFLFKPDQLDLNALMLQRTVNATLSVEKSRVLRYPDMINGKITPRIRNGFMVTDVTVNKTAVGKHHPSIDLGLCYIDGGRNEYAKVHPFRIQNMSSVRQPLSGVRLVSPYAYNIPF